MSRKKPPVPSKPKLRVAQRVPLTRDLVLHTAIRLADANGLVDLSMRKLAQLLGVEAMSLYNHVANKEDVLSGMVDLVAAEIALPVIDSGWGPDWRAVMRARATSAHAVLVRHPWAALLIVSRINAGPAMLSYIDATLGCLRQAGFSDQQADHAWNAIDSYIYGFTLQELHFPLEPADYAAAASHFLPMLPAERYPHMRALTEQVIDGSYDGLHEFTFGLDLILDGLERLRSGAR